MDFTDIDNGGLSLDNMISDEDSIDGFLNLDDVGGLEEDTTKPDETKQKEEPEAAQASEVL